MVPSSSLDLSQGCTFLHSKKQGVCVLSFPFSPSPLWVYACLSVCLSVFLWSLKMTPVIGYKGQPRPESSHLQILYPVISVKILLPSQVTCSGFGGRNLDITLECYHWIPNSCVYFSLKALAGDLSHPQLYFHLYVTLLSLHSLTPYPSKGTIIQSWGLCPDDLT